MRSLKSARASWQELHQFKSLRQLKDAVRLNGHTSIATSGLRSACWKAFLLFDTLDLDEWQRTLASSRSAYNSLHAHFFRFVENPDADAAGFDPLSQNTENSTWQQSAKDDDLRAEILQDVERCMLDFTREPETQRMLVDILFTFCKLNPDVGYRQGMHEVAAYVLWVIQDDAVVVDNSSRALGEDSIIKTVFDAEHVEHDSFAVFGQVMQSAAKSFYLSEGPTSISVRSKTIFEELLPQVDKALTNHLQSLDIVPQVFLIRWIRLLFVREFESNDVLALWDVLFAEDSSLEIVDHICVIMLLRIRWHLLEADYNHALGLLLRYPELDKDIPAQALGLDALYLKSHMNSEGASYCVLKYTGRPLQESGRPATPPALQRNITTFSGITSGVNRRAGQPRFEGLLQSTAKNIYAQGEKLGLGKAVRNAVDEVQKKAQEIRVAQTPSPPPWRHSSAIRVKELETRNKHLSELLAGAIGELWDYQKSVSENDKAKHDNNVEKLSAAIAKVQFIQVYLAQPSLHLTEPSLHVSKRERGNAAAESVTPVDGGARHDADTDATTHIGRVESHPENSSAATLADPSSFDDFADEDVTTAAPQSSARLGEDTQSPPSAKAKSHQLRPSLEQSSFSFMLGQDKDLETTPPQQATPDRPHSSLFGEQQQSPRRTGGASKSLYDDDFDMSSLKRAKGDRK
ncbi:Putative Rab-GTPase-TBC domain-containing protein [Septoria linicola]|uniref:Rab-GTPase-TBC domain-containing protein n=1 Tax=Septoria linicola TaxID=215465 RepID=A0A9Q9AI42_9PEZI|nr:Putative Rab-GTPase-TBC domain-containing protein [Septoria linicola]